MIPDGLDTPVATVDLAAVRRNIDRVQSYADAHGLSFRPHVKTHKIPAIAHLQLEAGAVGITCQKVSEAEIMSAAGIRDVLIATPIVGAAKLRRLRALTRLADVAVVADSTRVVSALSATFAEEESELDVLVECDTGLGRAGVQSPADAVVLAQVIDDLPGIHFAGVMTYPTSQRTGPFFREAIGLLGAKGISAATVSAGGTSGFDRTHLTPEINELRCGTYLYGDAACVADGSVALEDTALRIRSTVISRPTDERAILDAGSKTLTMDPNEGGVGGFGIVIEHPTATLYALHEEHGFLDVSRCDHPPEIGDVVTIVPNHACGCTNLHDRMVVHEDGLVVAEWDVAARGSLL